MNAVTTQPQKTCYVNGIDAIPPKQDVPSLMERIENLGEEVLDVTLTEEDILKTASDVKVPGDITPVNEINTFGELKKDCCLEKKCITLERAGQVECDFELTPRIDITEEIVKKGQDDTEEHCSITVESEVISECNGDVSSVVIKEHQVTIVEKPPYVTTSAPGRALRKLDPRKLNLTLELFSSKTKKKDKHKSGGGSTSNSLTNSDSPSNQSTITETNVIPTPVIATESTQNSIKSSKVGNTKKSSRSDSKKDETEMIVVNPPSSPKQSWLLRLFESQVTMETILHCYI